MVDIDMEIARGAGGRTALGGIDMETALVGGGRDPRDRRLGSLTFNPRLRTREEMINRPVGGTSQTSTNGVTQQSTFNYPAELPALTAEQQAALMSRRRQATRAFGETEASINRQRQRAQAEALRAQGEIERQQQLQSRAGMQTLAGRGVGRSPMFVNPFQRQLAEQSQRAVGQLQSGLADTLAQLESALRQADIARERELAQIDFDAGSFRSDVSRLLGG